MLEIKAPKDAEPENGNFLGLRHRVTLQVENMKYAILFGSLLVATILEASGDAIVRIGLTTAAPAPRLLLMMAGASILFGYGLTLNLAPLDFGPLIGAYVATFFVVGQIINFVIFRAPPTAPIIVGGMFILAGGAIITLWRS